MSFTGYPKDTIRFLSDLKDNNNREWFKANQDRYEKSFLQPSLAFIESIQKPLARAAPLLRAEPKKVGGSLMRIYKDTRFSKDKTPYKTNIGIQFRHESGSDVHAPGIYIHIAADECFFGAGTWMPPADALKQIRSYIDENRKAWKLVVNSKKMRNAFSFYEDRLKSAPRGFDKNHEMIDELRRRSFIVTCPLTRSQIESSQLIDLIVGYVKQSRPLMSALCEALKLPY